MEKKFNKMWEFVKDHKREILIGTGVAIAAGFGLYKITSRKPNIIVDLEQISTEATNCKNCFKPELGVGVVEDAIKYDCGTIELMLDQLKLSDMGRLGEEIANKIPDIPENAKVWSLLDIREQN